MQRAPLGPGPPTPSPTHKGICRGHPRAGPTTPSPTHGSMCWSPSVLGLAECRGAYAALCKQAMPRVPRTPCQSIAMPWRVLDQCPSDTGLTRGGAMAPRPCTAPNLGPTSSIRYPTPPMTDLSGGGGRTVLLFALLPPQSSVSRLRHTATPIPRKRVLAPPFSQQDHS